MQRWVRYGMAVLVGTIHRIWNRSSRCRHYCDSSCFWKIEHVAVSKDALGMGIVDLVSVRVASGTSSVTLAQINNVTELAKHINEQIELITK